jgi:phage baseplate assembly protein gpV
MHSAHPIHRALVTYSSSTTGEIRVKIPALLGADSEVAISYIGRKAPWVVPTVGDQIVVTSDDTNLTNLFWVPTSTIQGVSGTNGTNGDWATAQAVIPFSSATDGMGVLQPSSAGKLVYNTGSQTVFVNNFTAFSVGQRVDFARLNSGTFTISAASGATVNRTPANTLRAQYSAASLICTSANVYLLIGDLG